MKKNKIFALISLSSLLVSCGESNNINKLPDVNDPEYYNDINKRVSYNEDISNNIDEKFSNGVLDDNKWMTLDGVWHTDGTPHNGVQHRNLFYTKDNENNNLLAIKGRGLYSTEDPLTIGKPEGGCIISKNHLTPGRYEIEMSPFQREGSVTAMWTYCTTTGNEATSQNEIDIEIGGAGQFEKLWCTSWTKKTNKETKDPDVSDILYMNDGKMHKFTFDWYTDYCDTGTRRIDWFIDGKYVYSIEGDVVPEYEMPLWVGVWFPPYWAGNPAFIEDYMLVKNIKFTAFDDSQYFEDCRSEAGWTKLIPSQANIQTLPYKTIKNVNKISNNSFETLNPYDATSNDYYGWILDNASKGSMELDNSIKSDGLSSIKLIAGKDSSTAFHGQYLKQTITCCYPSYEYDLSIDACKLDDSSEGNIEIYYRDSTGVKISSQVIPVNNTGKLATYSQTLKVPSKASQIEIDITSENGTLYYDNASLILK